MDTSHITVYQYDKRKVLNIPRSLVKDIQFVNTNVKIFLVQSDVQGLVMAIVKIIGDTES